MVNIFLGRLKAIGWDTPGTWIGVGIFPDQLKVATGGKTPYAGLWVNISLGRLMVLGWIRRKRGLAEYLLRSFKGDRWEIRVALGAE